MKAPVPLMIHSVVAPNCTNKFVDQVVDADEIFLNAYLSAQRGWTYWKNAAWSSGSTTGATGRKGTRP